ncbi:GNAT family N-acetyltransferase [Paenibacillus sp. JCM 10914]
MRADQVEFDVRQEMSVIFGEGFAQWLGFFSKDPNKIAKAFAHMFVLDQFYVAIYNQQVVGITACTDGATHSVKLDKQELRKHLGFIKGSLAAKFLKREFENILDQPAPGIGSIEFVGTASSSRGKGVASKIIRHILENTDYKVYLIGEVADTNTPAMKLYRKLGFVEYQHRPIPKAQAKKIGINSMVSLKYEKAQ